MLVPFFYVINLKLIKFFITEILKNFSFNYSLDHCNLQPSQIVSYNGNPLT